jgi:hypothetical protein
MRNFILKKKPIDPNKELGLHILAHDIYDGRLTYGQNFNSSFIIT